jgi:hypothetical protein
VLPLASTLNFIKGATVANESIVRVGPDGHIKVRNASAGSVHIIVDLAGVFAGGGAVTMRGGFVPTTVPTRVLDTRSGLGYAAAVAANASITVNPQQPAAAAVALNVTVTEPKALGYLVVWPADRDRPLASQVNFKAKETVANFGQIRVSAAKTLGIANMSGGTAHVLADIAGYYTA